MNDNTRILFINIAIGSNGKHEHLLCKSLYCIIDSSIGMVKARQIISPIISLRDESERQLGRRQMALCMERPIQSLDDLKSELEISVGRIDRAGPGYLFKAVARYPLLAQFDPGQDNFYQGEWTGGGTMMPDYRLPHIYGYHPTFRHHHPLASKEHYAIIKECTGEWVASELDAQNKTAVEVNPHRLTMIRFDKPLHMAFLIGPFNYRIGTAEVRVNGTYKEGRNKKD